MCGTRTPWSNIKNVFHIPHIYKKSSGDRAFCAYAPRYWDELPDNIKAADSVQNYKRSLKTII